MRSYILFFCLAFSTGILAQKPLADPVANLKKYDDSLQYALGVYMGNYLLQGGFSTIDMNHFLVGLNDVYKNRPRAIKDSLAYIMLTKYQEEATRKRGKLIEEQLFAAIKDKPGLGRLPSGVQYLILKQGTGAKPLAGDSILIHYKGTLASGVVFENTFASNKPIPTSPAATIPGLNEALQSMSVGSTWEIFIPAALGYGEKGSLGIPANSALIVTVELLEIRKRN